MEIKRMTSERYRKYLCGILESLEELTEAPSECGGDAHLVFEKKKGSQALYRIFAQCKHCGHCGKANYMTDDIAISDWNGHNS